MHLPKTPETLGLIGDEALHKVKPTVRIVNAARGGLVDEEALAAALKEGRVAGAGIDVYAKEPCTDSPLFELDNVVVTPHLGASTDEAQEKAGIAVARSVRLALAGEFVPDAVNVQGGVIAEDVQPGLPLAEKLGRIFTALAGGVAARARRRGPRRDRPARRQGARALPRSRASSRTSSRRPVSYVNAPLFAQERGVEVRLTTSSEQPDYRNLVTVRGTLADGARSRSPARWPARSRSQKIVEVDGFDVDLALAEHLAFFRYDDRPGVVGPSAASSARPASTSPACRSPARPGRRGAGRAHRRRRVPAASSPRSPTRSARRRRARSTSRTDPERFPCGIRGVLKSGVVFQGGGSARGASGPQKGYARTTAARHRSPLGYASVRIDTGCLEEEWGCVGGGEARRAPGREPLEVPRDPGETARGTRSELQGVVSRIKDPELRALMGQRRGPGAVGQSRAPFSAMCSSSRSSPSFRSRPVSCSTRDSR